jgi:hypothetical protein
MQRQQQQQDDIATKIHIQPKDLINNKFIYQIPICVPRRYSKIQSKILESTLKQQQDDIVSKIIAVASAQTKIDNELSRLEKMNVSNKTFVEYVKKLQMDTFSLDNYLAHDLDERYDYSVVGDVGTILFESNGRRVRFSMRTFEIVEG